MSNLSNPAKLALERRYIVQDRESRCFLGYDEEGDMALVPYINRAFLFDDDENAALTGIALCDAGGYLIYGFWREFPIK